MIDLSISRLVFYIVSLFVLISQQLPLVAGNYPKELKVYRGSTPILDGKISPGEYDDATRFSGTTDWFREFSANSGSEDLSLKAWVKHDGKTLYFAFDVTDDVIYGIDIPRWLPDDAPLAHDFTVKNSLPWFGDGIEIFLNPENKWDSAGNDNTKGNGLSWQMVCSTHKSFKSGLKEGGLIEGELRNEYSWENYRKWMKSGAMKASMHIKTGSEGHGYIIEWMIAPKPCLEVSPGKYWSTKQGLVRMGLNIEVQDLDEKERGQGNFANMHHVDVWAEDPVKRGKSALKNLGTLTIYPDKKPENSVSGSERTENVNVYIGTSNGGNTNPGSVLPWGMVSLSPFNSYDTLSKSATGPSPYYYGNKYISGFTHMNMSGVGCADMGVICLMPTTGSFTLNQPKNTSVYSDEKAIPGYYSVILDRFNIKAELTTTCRTGISRYTFPKGKSNILLNLGIGVTTQKGGMLKWVSETEVEGLKSIGNICGIKSVQTIYFVARISKKPIASGVWIDGKDYPGFNREIAGNDIGAYFTYETEANEAIYVKVGVSYVSIANARINLDTEQPGYDFENTKIAAGQVWNKELSKIQVEGGTSDDRVKFYTALYHTLIQPSTASDVNGEYCTMGTNKVAKTEGYNRYTVFSLWDTYRNVHPFLALVYPKQQSDIVKTMLGMYMEGGWLPKWEFAGLEFYDMVGDPVVPVIADSYLRGIKDFDITLAYEAMKHNASVAEDGNPARPGLEDFLKSGYIPLNADCVFNPVTDFDKVFMWENLNTLKLVWGPVSTSMEYCIADWNIAQIAEKLGKADDYKLFSDRSLYYRNYFDKQTNFIRPKLKDGSWLEPFDPVSEKGFTEGGSWNYTFMVPHDIEGLIELMGGEKAYISKLTECFEKNHFFMANEPDIAFPYLFNYVKGDEWRTQKQVRNCVNKYFHNSPAGIWGNDDCGTMSTWLMYSMMGFYPDCPGNMNYQIASPVFSKITITLDPEYYPGKTFVIEAQNAGKDNCYIRSLELNGRSYKKYTLSHQDIIKGGSLVYKLDNKNQHAK